MLILIFEPKLSLCKAGQNNTLIKGKVLDPFLILIFSKLLSNQSDQGQGAGPLSDTHIINISKGLDPFLKLILSILFDPSNRSVRLLLSKGKGMDDFLILIFSKLSSNQSEQGRGAGPLSDLIHQIAVLGSCSNVLFIYKKNNFSSHPSRY